MKCVYMYTYVHVHVHVFQLHAYTQCTVNAQVQYVPAELFMCIVLLAIYDLFQMENSHKEFNEWLNL